MIENLPATFTVAAYGLAPFTYQWQQQTSGGSTWNNLSDGSTYSGSATATLTVTSAELSNSGEQFRCVVTNSSGSATSNAAALTVNQGPVPTITTQPVSQDVYAGQPVSFAVVASSSVPISFNGNSTVATSWAR